jgi:phosphate transport system substrate-binding protein
MKKMKGRPAGFGRLGLHAAALVLALSQGCGKGGTAARGGIHVDGSSTVYPLTEAVVEEFRLLSPGIQVAVGISGTGGGFEQFCAGEAEVADASRAIEPVELERCRAHGVEPLAFPIAKEGLSVVVHPSNAFAACLTVDELRRIWEPGSTVTNWKQVRPEWPDLEMSLFGPGVDSGTFDYFTQVIVGEERSSRSDYTASEDDNVLVHGVSGDRGALGYFGYPYYVESPELVKLVAIDAGDGCVLPGPETVASGAYRPLTRPLFLYVDRGALGREDVRTFVRFYLGRVAALAPEVGYVALAAADYEAAIKEIE